MLIQPNETNTLFPVFLKLEQLNVLLIGGGNVALEKLTAIVNNAPATRVRVVAKEVFPQFTEYALPKSQVEIIHAAYDPAYLDDCDVVIAAVNDVPLSTLIRNDARAKGKLINVADKPELCDFYLSSVVTKGNLKLAISTNGKSPTVAKRLKEIFTELLPAELDDVLHNVSHIRKGLKGDFEDKVHQLNEITKLLATGQAQLEEVTRPEQKKWQQVVKWCLFAFFFMIVGHALLSLVPFGSLLDFIKTIPQRIDTRMFVMMLLTGFMAQMIDGSLGMGYGTIATTFLLAIGVSPAIVSSRVHSARVFSSGVSGYSHHRFGNINKKLFRALVFPGVAGALLGATLAWAASKHESISTFVRIPLSFYTLYLGYFIIRKAFKKKKLDDKVKQAGWLASLGGFMDAFAGGGWGTLVTSTLISKRRSPRYVIGSVCLTEFFVVLASSVTFFILLKNLPLGDIAGLIIGGLIAAPIAARLVGKLPLKTMYISVGTLVIITSTITIIKGLSKLL